MSVEIGWGNSRCKKNKTTFWSQTSATVSSYATLPFGPSVQAGHEAVTMIRNTWLTSAMQDTHLLISQTLKLWLTPTIFLLLSFRAHRHQYIALIYVFFFLLRRFKSMCLTNTFVMEMDNELSQRGQSNLLFSKNEKLWKDVKGNWLIVQKKKEKKKKN